jgi:hypothetical protein
LTSAGFAAAAAVVEAQEFWQVIVPVPKSKKSYSSLTGQLSPLHTRADSPANARLGGGEVKWRDDRRIRKNH